MNIDEQKKEIRKRIKSLKGEISLDVKKKRSLSILNRLKNNKAFERAKTVMLYWSMDDEVFTHDFVVEYAKTKTIILPCVKGDVLELRVFKGLENLVDGDGFGIPEPSGDLFLGVDDIDLIVVPGVAFDNQNNRMGRGRAYYDKLLRTTNCEKIGICFKFQLLDKVPTDEYDIKMDLVISE